MLVTARSLVVESYAIEAYSLKAPVKAFYTLGMPTVRYALLQIYKAQPIGSDTMPLADV